MSDLAEHFERLKWVKEQIATLEQEVNAYTASDPLEVYWQLNLHPIYPSRVYRTRLRQELPKNIPIHAGAVINELRAILDALACTLAQRNGAKNMSSVYFPTGKNVEIFKSVNVQRKIKLLSEQDREAICALKPYPGGNDMLYALHSTDLIRKHQRLIILATGIQGSMIGGGGEWVLDGECIEFIKGSAPVGKPIAKTAAHYHIEIKPNAAVVFSEPAAIELKPLVATLNDFAGLVDSTLKLFAV